MKTGDIHSLDKRLTKLHNRLMSEDIRFMSELFVS